MHRRSCVLVASILCWLVTVVPAAAQRFKPISGNYVQVAAGRSEVWALGAANQVYRFDPTTTAFVQIPGTLKLSQIAVGGGSLLQADQVWGLSPTGNIYRFSSKNNAFGRVPGTLTQIVVGEGYHDNCHPYEVWGLDSSQLIHRYDFCASAFALVEGALTYITTGGGYVWGLNAGAQIFYYAHSSARFVQEPGALQQIVAGVDDDVWGTDASGVLYGYQRLYGGFEVIDGGAGKIAAGGHGLWCDYPGRGIFHFDLTGGGEFIEGPTGALEASQIAVGYGAGVWVVSTSHHIYTFVRP